MHPGERRGDMLYRPLGSTGVTVSAIGLGGYHIGQQSDAMDSVLHAERLDGKAKRTYRRSLDSLPDGAMVALDGEVFAVRDKHLLPWTPSGYSASKPRPRKLEVDVLTPPSILSVLGRGYAPLWHPSAG